MKFIHLIPLVAVSFAAIGDEVPKLKLNITRAQIKPESTQWNEAQIILTGAVGSVIAGPTALSFPPIYNHTLEIDVKEVLRGSLKAGGKIKVHHSARQEQKPEFPKGQCVLALELVQGTYRVLALKVAEPKELAEIRMHISLPMGWKFAEGKPVSPWSALGDKAWPKEQRVNDKLVCAKTGRPVLMTGDIATFKVENVAPKVAVEFTNPDGDGEYKITVANPSEKPVTVQALRTDGKTILWKESLVIICQGKAYAIPGASGIGKPTQALVLKPGETVSTVIHALALDGPDWPNGGQRIQFQFCLGEKSAVQSFYYMSRHHDSIRNGQKALQREAEIKPQS